MSAPDIVRASREPSAPSTHLGQVVAIESSYRARVTVGAGTITAHIPSAHRAVRASDSVRVTWQGGDPVITEVITRRAPVSYTMNGASTSVRTANTAPPAAVSGTTGGIYLPTVLALAPNGVPGDVTNSTSTAIEAALKNHANAINNWADSVNDTFNNISEWMIGASGTSGAHGQMSSVRDRVDDVQTATNTQSTVLSEVRNVAATYIKTDQKALGNSQ